MFLSLLKNERVQRELHSAFQTFIAGFLYDGALLLGTFAQTGDFSKAALYALGLSVSRVAVKIAYNVVLKVFKDLQ